MRTTDWEGEKKVCAVCNKAKIPSEFYKDNSNDDGLQIKCKSCERELRQARNRIPKTKGVEQTTLIPNEHSEEGEGIELTDDLDFDDIDVIEQPGGTLLDRYGSLQ